MRGRADAIVTQELRPWPAAPPPRLMIFLFSSDVHRYMLGIPAEYCSLSQYDTLYYSTTLSRLWPYLLLDYLLAHSHKAIAP